MLEVGYVGTHSIHLRETRDALQSQDATPTNPVDISSSFCNPSPCVITTNTFANAVARSRAQGINGYAGFQLFANDAYSHYNSLQTTVSRRWGAGYFQAAYTFSKSTDATSTGNTAFNTAFNDESTLNDSRGLSDFDRTHRLAVSYRYDLPFFKSAEGVTHTLLAGWAISGITIIQSGAPFSVLDSGAGTGFLGSGFRSRGADGESGARGYAFERYVQRKYRHAGQRLFEPQRVHTGAASLPGAVRSHKQSQLLHHRIRKSGTQHLPRAGAAELGLLGDQKLQDYRAAGTAVHYRFL